MRKGKGVGVMVILLVDNDKESLLKLETYIRAYKEKDTVLSFSDSLSAMEYIEEHEVDLLFTEIRMSGATGFTVTQALKNKKSNSYVVFVTDTSEYAMNAWDAHVNGYILKPFDKKKIETELNYADMSLLST